MALAKSLLRYTVEGLAKDRTLTRVRKLYIYLFLRWLKPVSTLIKDLVNRRIDTTTLPFNSNVITPVIDEKDSVIYVK
mgnify:CR=1 FL=1